MAASGNLQIVDYVWPNAADGKTSLLGLIGELHALNFPAEVFGLHCHWLGSYPDAPVGSEHEFAIDFEHAGQTHRLLSGKMRIADPTQTVAFHSVLPPVRITAEGWSKFVLIFDGAEVSAAALPVRKKALQ